MIPDLQLWSCEVAQVCALVDWLPSACGGIEESGSSDAAMLATLATLCPVIIMRLTRGRVFQDRQLMPWQISKADWCCVSPQR